jgi:signal transduction histidine kinase
MLGRPVVGRTSRDRVFPYASPHLGPDGQSTGGVIWTTFLPDSFAALFQRIALDPQDTVMLVRADGVVLPRYPWIDLTELTALAPEDPPMRSVADAVARADAEAMLRQSQRVEVLGGQPPWIAGHPAELDSALMNLVLNARDAMPAGGEITIALRPTADAPGLAPGHYMELSVSDRGMGMDADTLARATEAFFTTKPMGGTGLGLSSIRGFVDGASGTMQLHSTPGQGTTVTLWLPEAPESPA